MVEARRARSSDAIRLGSLFGRAFVTEPLMAWPLGGADEELEDRCVRAYTLYLGPLLDAGMVWESADGRGAMVLVSPDQGEVWDVALACVDTALGGHPSADGGARHERFWGWIGSRIPPEPVWHLDSVAVEPGWQGHGIGSALVGFGLEQARSSGAPMILETGTARNVPLYERLGFRVIDEADPPEGGPHVWFMRWVP